MFWRVQRLKQTERLSVKHNFSYLLKNISRESKREESQTKTIYISLLSIYARTRERIVFRRTCNFVPSGRARRKKNPKNPSSEGRELTTLDEGTKKTLSSTFSFCVSLSLSLSPLPLSSVTRSRWILRVEKRGLTQFMHPKQTETRLYYKYRGTGQKISGRAVGPDPPVRLARESNLPRRARTFLPVQSVQSVEYRK